MKKVKLILSFLMLACMSFASPPVEPLRSSGQTNEYVINEMSIAGEVPFTVVDCYSFCMDVCCQYDNIPDICQTWNIYSYNEIPSLTIAAGTTGIDKQVVSDKPIYNSIVISGGNINRTDIMEVCDKTLILAYIASEKFNSYNPSAGIV